MATAGRASGAGLLGVVGDIPACPLELKGRGREQPLHLTTTFLTGTDRRSPYPLNHFGAVATAVTFVLVKRQGKSSLLYFLPPEPSLIFTGPWREDFFAWVFV